MKSFFSVASYMTFIFNVCSTRKRCISRIWADIGYSFELLLFLTLGSSLLWKYMMEFQRNAITIRNMLPNIEHVFPIQRWEFELCGRHLDEIHRSRYSTYFFFSSPCRWYLSCSVEAVISCDLFVPTVADFLFRLISSIDSLFPGDWIR